MSRPKSPWLPGWARPIRIPESIEITHAEPPYAVAGQVGTWRLCFKLSKDVPAGTTLTLQLWGGRNNHGVFAAAQSTSPAGEGYLTATLSDGRALPLAAETPLGTFAVSLPENGLRRGQVLTVVLGDRADGGPGVRACRDRMLNKFFVLHSAGLDQADAPVPNWAGGTVWAQVTNHRIVAACTLHILGGTTDHLRAFVPASVRPGVPFTLLVRPEDEFGDLSHEPPGPFDLLLNGVPLEHTVEAVAGSTCLRARATLTAPGVHRITLRDAASGREVLSNPTVCSTTALPTYWGMIHGHTEMSDGTGTLEQYFHQLRHEVALEFAATADHDHRWETPEEFWQATCAVVKRWHAPGEFVTFLGYEWAKWRRNGDGDRNVCYLDDDQPMYRSDDGDYPRPPDLFGALRHNPSRAIVIPHHTGHGGNFCDWKDHSPEHERLVEMFQVRGSFECSREDGNPVPETCAEPAPYPEGYVQHALALGWRVGFTAGGDDHSGHWGTEVRFGDARTGYKQGLMSVAAPALNRPAVFEALYRRRVVATTGARILLSFTLDDRPYGGEWSLRERPELAARRHLEVEWHGTAPLARLDVIRGNRVAHSVAGTGGLDLCMAWDDVKPIENVWLPPAQFCPHPFLFYYVRAIQTDGEVAWASPIWVDP